MAWDNNADCTVYAYFNVDSALSVKSFFAYQKQINAFANGYDTAAVFVKPATLFPVCVVGAVQNSGQPACAGNGGALPATLQLFFTSQPRPGNPGTVPLHYCGQNGATGLTTKWCFFNVALSDTRPEDALYSTTRALGAIPANHNMTGLGYDAPACLAVNANVGCATHESFGLGGSISLAKFALSGADPISGALVPAYTTLNIGAAPVVVFVNDADPNGFGAGAPNNYVINNILHKQLAFYEDGTSSCTGDASLSVYGPGNPVQVVQREPLAGVFNTLEYTAVRTLTGSATAAVDEAAVNATTWFSDDTSSQELNNNPVTNFSLAPCGGVFGVGAIPNGICGDPKLLPTNACGANGKGSILRATNPIEMVKATLGLEVTQIPANPTILTPDGLGYAFWRYPDFNNAAAGCAPGVGVLAGCTFLGHYLTVDGVDPLFDTPVANPYGAYHLPQCDLQSGLNLPCPAIPFTHVYDGSYPLWTMLRAITFSNVAGANGQTTPPAVTNMIAAAENLANTSTPTFFLGDFVPFFTNVNLLTNHADLNLTVFRVHYKQTGSAISPVDGYAACGGVFTAIPLTPVVGGCTIEAGADMGGSVFTVESDVDFSVDFGAVAGDPHELYGLHQ